MKHVFAEPSVFRPSLLKSQRDRKSQLYPLNAAPVVREGRILYDNTMPPKRWADYDKPAFLRMTARRVRQTKVIEPALLRRQA